MTSEKLEKLHGNLVDALCGVDWIHAHERHGLSGPEGCADRIIDMLVEEGYCDSSQEKWNQFSPVFKGC